MGGSQVTRDKGARFIWTQARSLEVGDDIYWDMTDAYTKEPIRVREVNVGQLTTVINGIHRLELETPVVLAYRP